MKLELGICAGLLAMTTFTKIFYCLAVDIGAGRGRVIRGVLIGTCTVPTDIRK